MKRIAEADPVDLVDPFLDADDDPALWRAAIGVLSRDLAFATARLERHRTVLWSIGACSHWLRPHQMRWKAAGGFAWPVGYSGTGWFFAAVPEFDWSVDLIWNPRAGIWEAAGRRQRKRVLTFRAALPTRTMRHEQAAIHTIWRPGPPAPTDMKTRRFYGFRKRPDGWDCVATEDM